MTMQPPSETTMRQAFRGKDPAYDGLFVVAVKTTGIYCRPTCRAKPPLEKNIRFFESAGAAEHQGYRACKLCRPQDAAGQRPALVRRLVDLAETDGQRLRDVDLSQIGIDPTTARRQFRAHLGMTFAAYQRDRKLGAAAQLLKKGTSAAHAQQAAGFESASGFREALAKLVAGPAGAGGTRMLLADRIETPLGPMLAVADDAGLVVLDFVDRAELSRHLHARLRLLGTSTAPAVIVPGKHAQLDAARRQIDQYFAGQRIMFDLRLNPIGTEFDLKAWQYLASIPPGQTRTYGAQAAALGAPSASRAVGRANGRNLLAVVIPCHRVVGASGKMTGYGGGMHRKAWLLQHERKIIAGKRLQSAQAPAFP